MSIIAIASVIAMTPLFPAENDLLWAVEDVGHEIERICLDYGDFEVEKVNTACLTLISALDRLDIALRLGIADGPELISNTDNIPWCGWEPKFRRLAEIAERFGNDEAANRWWLLEGYYQQWDPRCEGSPTMWWGNYEEAHDAFLSGGHIELATSAAGFAADRWYSYFTQGNLDCHCMPSYGSAAHLCWPSEKAACIEHEMERERHECRKEHCSTLNTSAIEPMLRWHATVASARLAAWKSNTFATITAFLGGRRM